MRVVFPKTAASLAWAHTTPRRLNSEIKAHVVITPLLVACYLNRIINGQTNRDLADCLLIDLNIGQINI